MRYTYSKLLVIIFFVFIKSCLLPELFAQLPAGFTSTIVQNTYTAPMGVVFGNNGNSMFVWEKSGRVFISKWSGTAYVKQGTAVLDIRDEVGDWRDFGLLSFCLDPDFNVNGLVYLYYVVDRHHLINFGTPQYNAATNDYFKATIGRVTRYHILDGATVTTDYSSRKILIGESITTGIPLLHESHMGGTLIFGRDKTLLLTAGDGASYNVADLGSSNDTYFTLALQNGIIRAQENVGAFRAQMVNSMSGKLLRFDPNTGDGLPSNPFYDAANPRAPKSRIWAMGLRNPFRMSIQPNTGSTVAADGNPGTFIVGDVGWNDWEEINVINTGGLNCGWPLFEGLTAGVVAYSTATTVNQDEGQQFKNLCAQPTSFAVNPVVASRRFTHYRAAIAWKHGADEPRVPFFSGSTPTNPIIGSAGSPTTGQVFTGNCTAGGVYYTGTAFGPAYQNKFFFGDYGANFIKVSNLNATQPWMTSISNFAPYNFSNGMVDMEQNPLDNSVFYVNINSGEIMRISMAGNSPPVVSITSTPSFGGSPLVVNFSSAGTTDPDGGSITYLWDFGDGTTSVLANPTHTFSSPSVRSFTATLTATDGAGLSTSKSLTISINNTPPVARIINPANNSKYSILNATQIPLSATVTDNESTAGLQYAWLVALRHNNHEHREPINTNPNPTVQISPVGCDGETYYYLIQLTVTDNGGLVSSDSVKIYPDCSLAGLGVTNLTAIPQGNSATLSWTNPTGPFDEIMVAARPGSGFLSNPSGTNYVADASYTGSGTSFEQGKIVYKGTGQGVNVTNLSAGTVYYFRVFTRIGTSWTGGVETSAILGTNLTGSGIASTATIDLTAEGTSDWAHWSGYDHKASGGSKISNYVLVGTGTASNYNNDLRRCTWSDGTPTASGSNLNGIYITGAGKGFQITAPADLTLRTLKVYAGGWISGGTLTASLSDGSSPDYVNAAFSGTGQYNVVYTLAYRAASAGKLLTVKWVQNSGSGNVTLQGATLSQSSATINVTGVTMNPLTASLPVGNTQQLTATIAPANATNQTITWSSNNTSVATVNSNGLVSALNPGTAVITVTTQDGNKTATCNVTVTAVSIPVTSVALNPASASINVGATQQLTATITPSNATNKNVSWSSSNTGSCTVNASGLVSGAGAGTAVITVTTQDGNKTATCNITVTIPNVPVTGVSVNPTTVSIAAGSTQQLTATVVPANATNKTVSWTSSNIAVCTVSASGLVSGVGTGTAMVTVTTQDGNKTAVSTINVTTVQAAFLTGSVVSSTATINLTNEGSSDWAHWLGYAHKSTGGSQISNYSIVGTGTASNYNNDLRTCTWSDGTPTASGSNKDGIYITGAGKGFQITAPADLTQRTLKVYIGGWISAGTLTAQLSDGSATNYVNSSLSGSGQYNGVYSLSYKAASAGKQIIVRWVQASGAGNVTLQAATLATNAQLQRSEGNILNVNDLAVGLGNKSLSVYPNPFYEQIILNYSGRETGKGTISVYTAEMRLVAVYPFLKNTTMLNKKIPAAELSKGTYFIRFNLGELNIIRRQVKLE